MADKKIKLVHPIIGEQLFPEVQAKRILENPNNGGWTLDESKDNGSNGDSENTEGQQKAKSKRNKRSDKAAG